MHYAYCKNTRWNEWNPGYKHTYLLDELKTNSYAKNVSLV